jgi:hypothetical protein
LNLFVFSDILLDIFEIEDSKCHTLIILSKKGRGWFYINYSSHEGRDITGFTHVIEEAKWLWDAVA